MEISNVLIVTPLVVVLMCRCGLINPEVSVAARKQANPTNASDFERFESGKSVQVESKRIA
jgi:hypothetical protein